jgi:replicative DNA helicase
MNASSASPALHTLSGSDDRPSRLPPANLEAEQALLAAVLANNHAFERVSEYLQPDHFADAAHARIYEACRKLIERGQQANAITLRNVFDQDGDLAEVGGAEYLAQLQSSYVTIDARHYGQLVYDLYLRRELIDLGEEIVNEAFRHDLEISATDQIETAEQRLYNLSELGQTEGGLQAFRVGLAEAIESAEAAYKRDTSLVGVTSGFDDLDDYLGGLHRSDLLILAGRPSMGKTALATNIAVNAARSKRIERDQDGYEVEMPEVVAFFSLEMSSEQLASRIIAEAADVRSDLMRKGQLSEEEMRRVLDVHRELERLPLYIDDTPGITVAALRSRARRLKRQYGLSMIVVDYLQLLQPPAGMRSDNRVQEVSEITRNLKIVAKELNVPVIALSQLSRQVENRDDKRPQLADLRESGSIEQDADVVMFIYREEYYLAREEPAQRLNETEDKYQERLDRYKERLDKAQNKADVIIAKQRHGPIGTVTLHFNPDRVRFSNLADEERLPEAY